MNLTEDQFSKSPLKSHLERNESTLKLVYGNVQVLRSFDTYQIDDYSNVDYSFFDLNQKLEHRDNQFPIDCRKAFEMGKNSIKA